MEILLTQGKVALVDDEDYPVIAPFKWSAVKINNCWYAQRGVYADGKTTTVYMHRQLMGVTDRKIKVDHEDGDGLNNRRRNMRVATHQQNICNSRLGVNNTSGYKGVFFSKEKQKWYGQVKAQGVTHHCGYHATREEAARARDEKALALHGSFATQSFIPQQAA